MPGLEIRLFGVGKVRHDGAAGPDTLAPAVRALLGYLVLNRHRPHHRDLLANEFWSDVDDASARNRLSTALWRLRRVLEPDGVQAGSYLVATRDGEVGFNDRSDYWLDVAVFERAAETVLDPRAVPGVEELAAFEHAASVFDNDLLEGADQPWLVLERERLTQQYLSATARCMDRYAALGDVDHAIASARRILDREPLREDTHRALIRLYARTGQRSLASRQYDQCRQLLRDELGVAPLPETVAAAAVVDGPASAGDGQVPIEQAIAVIENASRSLGLAVHELDDIVRTLRDALPQR
jgi:DNA-binding SARP family transcriptional activator